MGFDVRQASSIPVIRSRKRRSVGNVLDVDPELDLSDKLMRLRYAGTCRVCGVDLPVKIEAIYERATKTVRCVSHDDVAIVADQENITRVAVESVELPPIDPGTPGASARREFERRAAKREERVRTNHPKLGGLILALSDDSQTTRAWDIGAVGEERLGRRFNESASDSLRVLHDRRIPGSRANIDHIAVAPTGVYVIDAKKYKGQPHLRVEGGVLRPRVEKLMVGTRDCTKVVDGVLEQVDIVRGIVGDAAPIHDVLCFVEADWPLIGGSFTTRGVEALWPKRLYPKLKASGPLALDEFADIHRRLAEALPQA